MMDPLKFIYSEKATHFCEISTVDLSYVVTVKSTVEILQNFVAFSEYMNFKGQGKSVVSPKNEILIHTHARLDLLDTTTRYIRRSM